MANLQAGHVHRDDGEKPIPHENSNASYSGYINNTDNAASGMSGRAESTFWLTTLGPLGSVRYLFERRSGNAY